MLILKDILLNAPVAGWEQHTCIFPVVSREPVFLKDNAGKLPGHSGQ